MLPESPYPPQCGNALRDVQQIRVLQQMGFLIHLLLVRRRSDLEEPERNFLPPGVEASYASHAPVYRESWLSLLWRKTGYLLWSRKHAFAWWTSTTRPAEFLAAEIERRKPLAVVMRSIFMDGIADLRRTYDGPIVLDCHDADVHLAAEALRSVPFWRRFGPFTNWLAIRRACRYSLPLADEIWAVSGQDAERIRAQAVVKRVVVVPSTVAFHSETGLDSDGTVAVMIANYGYGPNANGARWLIENIWPFVLRAMPEARLELVGANMPEELEKRCRLTSHCTVHGRVDDLEPIYRRASVIVAPIREGGGTRLKIVEAWAWGKAVLTTSKGMEGLPAPEQCAAVTDNPLLFAQMLVMLFKQPAWRERLGNCGRAFVREQFSYTRVREILEDQSLLAAVRA